MKVYEIIPGLYQRGRIHHFGVDLKRVELQKKDIRDVVALAPNHPDPDLEFLDDLGIIRYKHLPIPDGRLQIPETLLELGRVLAGRIEAGTGVLVMCNAGRNRSGLLSALIVRERLGISGERALEVVQRQRPNALANENFCAFLVSLPTPDG